MQKVNLFHRVEIEQYLSIVSLSGGLYIDLTFLKLCRFVNLDLENHRKLQLLYGDVNEDRDVKFLPIVTSIP